MIEPLSVGKPSREGQYILLDGHTRLVALKQLGFDAMMFHDDDAVPEIDSKSSAQVLKEAKALKKRLEEQGPALLADLAAASRGRWTASGGPLQGIFTATKGTVRGVVEGPVPVEPEDDDPWIDGVVPARVE